MRTQTLLKLDAEKMDKQKATDLITQLHEKLLEVNCITKALIECKQKRMYIFTISEHPMTGPFFEPSVIQSIYEQLPTKGKPKIVDANCKFMMNDRSLMKHLKNVQNPLNLSQIRVLHLLHDQKLRKLFPHSTQIEHGEISLSLFHISKNLLQKRILPRFFVL